MSVLAAFFLPASQASAATTTFTFNGAAQQFTVPAGVTSLTIDMYGAEGGIGLGDPGLGGQTTATISVSPGEVIQVMVGGQGTGGNGGFNGGGDGGTGGFNPVSGGGGASDIRTGACAAALSCTLADRVVVAGGGGGSEGALLYGQSTGGDGGQVGGDGTDDSFLGISGFGGTATAGGAAGTNAAGGTAGTPGALGMGGTGGDAFNGGSAGGGGGGGYYGGGGGGGGDDFVNDPSGGNGGGGSGFGPGGATFATGVRTGDGEVVLTWTAAPTTTPTTTAVVTSNPFSPSVVGQPVTFTAQVTPPPTGGTVQFQVDGTNAGAPVPVDGTGSASSAAISNLALGNRSIVAIYSGDPSFDPSTSAPIAYVVDQATASVAITASPNPVDEALTVAYVATITIDAPGAATPTGTVAFSDDSVPIAGCTAVPIVGVGTATCNAIAGPPGNHIIGAAYSGTADIAASTGQVSLTVNVVPPATTTTTASPPTTTPPTTAPSTTAPSTTAPPTTAPSTTAPPTTATPTTTRQAATNPAATVPAPTSAAAVVSSTATSASTTTSPSTTTTSRPTTTTAPPTTTEPPTTTAPPTEDAEADARLVLNVIVGASIEGATAEVSGEGFWAGSAVTIRMFSDPVDLGTAIIDPDGTFDADVTIPAATEPGDHRIVVAGVSMDGEAVDYTWYLQVDDEAVLQEFEPEPLEEPPGWYTPEELAFAIDDTGGLAEYVVTEHAAAAVATMVSGFALLTMLSGNGTGFAGLGGSGTTLGSGLTGGFAGGSGPIGGARGALVAGGAASAAQAGAASDPKGKRGLARTENKHSLLSVADTAWGDRSGTWRFPMGLDTIDRFSLEVPPRISATSPFAARLLGDATYLRAMFGSLSIVMPLLGVLLGIVAAADVGTQPIPPAVGLVAAIIVIGIIDALAGFAAAATFAGLAIAAGNVTSTDSLRGLIGLCVLFFAVPLLASVARPFRREPTTTKIEHFDRVADVVIASLIGAWGAKKLVGALPALAALDFPIAARSGTIALVVLVALAVRLLAETGVVWWYPQRLGHVSPEDLPAPSKVQRVTAITFQAALLFFVAIAYLGNGWELWAGVAIFAIPQLISLFKDSLPNAPWLVRAIPGGITKTTVMLVVGTLFAGFVAARIDDPARFIKIGFVVLSVPGLVVTAMGWFGRSGTKWNLTWFHRVAGIGVLMLGVLLAEKIITIG